MLRAVFVCLLILVSLRPTGRAVAEPASACLEAASLAERAWALPPDIIAAIGRAESGRVNPLTGRLAPWPWTVNAGGQGSYFNSRGEAVAFVRGLQSRGVRVIDVGCFQIDLFYHPEAFASLEQAFDPAANADYAARFLSLLHSQSGDWPSAVAAYHSADAQEGGAYRRRVMALWQRGGRYGPSVAVADHSREPAHDRYVVMMSAEARTIHVIGPSGWHGVSPQN